MEPVTVKRKWANWKFIAFIVVLIAIFVKFFVLNDHDENAPVTVEMDLSQVAFRNQDEVEAVLGKGKLDSYYKDEEAGCDKCPKMIYRDGKIEIIYISEIADRIMLKDLSDYDFENRVILGLLNLKENIAPKLDEDKLKRWDNYEKFTQISAFSNGNDLDYILIKAKTK
ncbi:hypothetical protein [Dyadobacter arcticus]|uniref:Uncharacterized protein n=1 Tax=Dyadobacter arcticus TaxID=1078754 RepID=A0ABX0UXU8_9BACT|nr:hypothetical protein [Dyadobacter arcticus]NIJ55746.1 hypothetical protein [Dyadobacter arcticus]